MSIADNPLSKQRYYGERTPLLRCRTPDGELRLLPGGGRLRVGDGVSLRERCGKKAGASRRWGRLIPRCLHTRRMARVTSVADAPVTSSEGEAGAGGKRGWAAADAVRWLEFRARSSEPALHAIRFWRHSWIRSVRPVIGAIVRLRANESRCSQTTARTAREHP